MTLVPLELLSNPTWLRAEVRGRDGQQPLTEERVVPLQVPYDVSLLLHKLLQARERPESSLRGNIVGVSIDFFFFKYIRLWLGFIKFLNFHCVHKQAREGTDQLQGQGGQNEVQVPCAGLREGVLQAEEKEECRAASGVYHQWKSFQMSC